MTEENQAAPCGPTHYEGCPCHEARHRAEVAALRTENAALREIVRAVATLDISAIDQDIYGWSGEIEIDGLIKQARALLASGDAHPQQEN